MSFYTDAPTRTLRLRPDVLAVGGKRATIRVAIAPALGDATRVLAPTGDPISLAPVVVLTDDQPVEVEVLASDAPGLVDAQGGIIARFPYVAAITDERGNHLAVASFYADEDNTPLDVDTVLGSGPPALPEGTPVYDQVLDLVRDAQAASADAEEDANAADVYRQNAATSATLADGYRAGALAARDQAHGWRDQADAAATTATIAAGAATTARTGAEAARDAALAQSFGGGDLGTLDLNTVVVPGVYRQGTSANATAARNYPTDAVNTWVVDVRRSSSGNTSVVQYATPAGGSGLNRARVIYLRRSADGGATWTGWVDFASQRIDRTAGLAVYKWDPGLAREQLVYGDTGWRDVSASLANGWAGTVLVRRVGYSVSWRFILDSASATSTALLSAGVGSGWRSLTGANTNFAIRPASGTGNVWCSIAGASALPQITTGVALNTNANEITYATTDPWPTTLPGTPVGTIPNL